MFLVLGEAGIVDDVHGRRKMVRRISHDCFSVQFSDGSIMVGLSSSDLRSRRYLRDS
jgi:hypothetical protein